MNRTMHIATNTEIKWDGSTVNYGYQVPAREMSKRRLKRKMQKKAMRRDCAYTIITVSTISAR